MKIYIILAFFTVYLYGQIDEHHEHSGTTQLKLNYEYLDFENSKQKYDANRYGVEIDHQSDVHHAQLYVEHTDTHTQEHIPKDLLVDKIALKYQNSIDYKNTVILSYMHVKDNIIHAVDGANVYGIGYKYKFITLTQYLSDYKDFDVYQTDLKLGMKKSFSGIDFMGAVVGKYIYLDDRLSNDYTKKTNKEYSTLGIKLHADYKGYHAGVGTYIGERIFAVMNDGLRVQHHSMEFKKSYMFSLAKEFDDLLINLRYIKQEAKEVPIDNDNVKASNVSVTFEYRF